ncbi:hypothetical protein FPOA_06518 [Fusarium poae]|uniref:Acyltransferase 3 domain-containing protein n=1 Tax=Fusarium poae TaxID=36050 RepID=A0A1B8AZS2_FUSPO|nr:hypothetical protein FPOA_06518 [Fusarium poae]
MVTAITLQNELGTMGNIDRSWPAKCMYIASALLPSFLHKYTPFSQEMPQYHYESLPQQAHRQDTCFLDGMRGLAALCVFLEHLLLPFWKDIFYAYGSSKDSSNLLQLPIVQLLYSGSPMVCIVFIISGIALSLKPARLAREGEWQDFYKSLSSMAFRRGIRLFAPCLLASFAHMIMAQAGWSGIQSAVPWEGPPEIVDEFWLKQPEHLPSLLTQLSQWVHFFVDKVVIPSTWRGTSISGRDYGDLEHVEYGSQLWTVGIEYWSSLVLFTVLLGTADVRLVFKMIIITTSAGFSLCISRWDVALFLYGCLLGHLDSLQPSPKVHRNRVWEHIIFGLLFCLGLHIASFPELGGPQTPSFSWLPFNGNSRLWQSVGASLIVLCSVKLVALRNAFSHHVLLYLGRISFAIYITHVPLLGTIGWRIFAFVITSLGWETYLAQLGGGIISLSVLVPIQIWVADIFCRFVDEPCNNLATRVYSYSTTST